MKLIIAASIAIGIAVFAHTSIAQPGPPSFDSLDADQNGALSKQELAVLMERFAAGRPGAGDGPREGGAERGGARRRPNIDVMFGRWDADGNGAVSREEFDNRPRRRGPGGRGGPERN
jgi:hypothetical protein